MILSMMAAASRYLVNSLDPQYWNGGGWGGATAVSGEKVDPDTSMSLAAVYACIDVISTDSSVFPINIKRRSGGGKIEDANDIKRNEYRLLNFKANDNSTAITMRRFIAAQCLGWGNGIGEFQRYGDNSIYQIHPIEMRYLEPALDDSGRLYWKLDKNGEKRRINDEDVFHLCGPSDNGIVGWPVSYWATDAFGAGISQQKYAGAFFRNQGVPSGILSHPGRMSAEAEKKILAAWVARHSGSAANSHKIALLMEGMDFKATSINPRDAEMIDERRFSIEEICRWYRMKPSKIQHYFQAKGWQTTEQDNKSYLLETLMPWLERIEAEINRKILDPEGTGEFYAEHDFSRLLQPDAAARADQYSKLFQVGAYTINEILQKEGHNGIGPDGDVRFVMSNLTTLERAIDPPEPPPQLVPPAQQDKDGEEDEEDTEEDVDTGNEEDTDAEAQLHAFVVRTLTRSISRFMRKEANAIKRIVDKHGCKGEQTDEKVRAFGAKHYAQLLDELCDAIGCVLPDLCAARSFMDAECESACMLYASLDTPDAIAGSAAAREGAYAGWLAKEFYELTKLETGAQNA